MLSKHDSRNVFKTCKHFRGAANEATASNPLPAEGNKGSMSSGYWLLQILAKSQDDCRPLGTRAAVGTRRQSSTWMRPHKVPPVAEVLLVVAGGKTGQLSSGVWPLVVLHLLGRH